MTYTAVFFGRKVGAIGVCHGIETTVSAPDKEAARLALYERFEHIEALELQAKMPEPDPSRRRIYGIERRRS